MINRHCSEEKMNEIKIQLNDDRYWNEVYDRMSMKIGVTAEDRNNMLILNTVYKEQIINELMSGEYEWSIPRKVEIAKAESTKKRVVYMYDLEDRYILGVLYRAISEVYKDEFSNNCFSYKKGTNTSNAIQHIKDTKLESNKVGVKMDIHAYFNSVSEVRVTELIYGWFCGGLNKTLRKLMLTNKVMHHGKEIDEWKSLIPGCALGSFFANACLIDVDNHFDRLGITYARYSDDIILFDDTKEEVDKHIKYILNVLNEYGLTMNPDKYTYFINNEEVEYLGLKIRKDGKIDISNHAKQKIKKQVHRWCKKGRIEIEKGEDTFEHKAKQIVRRINYKNMKCILDNETLFGWCGYSFRYITTVDSLREIDLYTKDTLRAMKTGKHNKANYRAISDREFKDMGWVSLVEMYSLYKKDKDYYYEIVSLI